MFCSRTGSTPRPASTPRIRDRQRSRLRRQRPHRTTSPALFHALRFLPDRAAPCLCTRSAPQSSHPPRPSGFAALPPATDEAPCSRCSWPAREAPRQAVLPGTLAGWRTYPTGRWRRAASGVAGHGGPSPERRPRRSVHCLVVVLALASAGCAALFDDGSGGASGDGSGAGGPPSATPGASQGPGRPPGSGSPVTVPANPSATAPAPAPGALDPTGPVGGFGPALLDRARGFRIDLLIEPGAEPAGGPCRR